MCSEIWKILYYIDNDNFLMGIGSELNILVLLWSMSNRQTQEKRKQKKIKKHTKDDFNFEETVGGGSFSSVYLFFYFS